MPIGDDTNVSYRGYLPHLEKHGKTYFVTWCTKNRSPLEPEARSIALECAVYEHRRTAWLDCLIVMPDHVHLVLMPYEQSLAKMMNRIKGISSRRINARRGTTGHLWQRDYFDRAPRSGEDPRRKAEYVCLNPVRAGLVKSVNDYPWIWRSWIDGGATE